jgi:hypothetical protein
MSSDSQPNNIVVSEDIQFAPFRPLDEFILDKARFDKPSFNDLKKWNNRILTNLLYFQTNYFVIGLILVLFISFFHAKAVVIGFSAVALVGGVVAFALSKRENLVQLRGQHPYVLLVLIVIVGYYFISVLPSVITLLYMSAAPLIITFVHASVRLRNISAKVNQKAEQLQMRNTVMSQILRTFNIELSS